MPTLDECQELIDNCDGVWTDDYNGTGVAGCIFTSKVNGNSVFLPAAGLCYNSSVFSVGSYGRYWSSVPDSDDYYAWTLYFSSRYHDTGSNGRYWGRSVRPLQGFTK